MPIDEGTFESGEEHNSIENEVIHFLYEHRDEAYTVREVAEEVMDAGWSEANVEAEFDWVVGCFVDIATVNSVLDKLVGNGRVERRIVDAGEGRRSYYRAP